MIEMIIGKYHNKGKSKKVDLEKIERIAKINPSNAVMMLKAYIRILKESSIDGMQIKEDNGSFLIITPDSKYWIYDIKHHDWIDVTPNKKIIEKCVELE